MFEKFMEWWSVYVTKPQPPTHEHSAIAKDSFYAGWNAALKTLGCNAHNGGATADDVQSAAIEQHWADRADAEGVPYGTY